MSLPTVEARLVRMKSGCQTAGLPLTAQRRALLSELAPRMDHPTVEQVYSAVRGRLSGVSKATVYRTLETLDRLGLIRRVEHPGSAVRFDPDPTPHHHLL